MQDGDGGARRRVRRAAATQALQNLRKPGILSPKKGIVRNNDGCNQFPVSSEKRRRQIVLRKKTVQLVTPSTDPEQKRR